MHVENFPLYGKFSQRRDESLRGQICGKDLELCLNNTKTHKRPFLTEIDGGREGGREGGRKRL